jgi:sterol 3beta-glucosyltransferase
MSHEKPIVFLTSGTRGDVQPVIPLARGLQERGYAVRIAAPPAFCDLIQSHGVPFAAVEGNPSDLMIAQSGEIALTFDGNLIHSARSSLSYLHEAQSVYAQMFVNAWEVCQDACALVIGLPTLWGTSIAEKLNIPCIGAFLQPLTPTREFPCPALPLTRSFGKEYNHLTYFLLGLLTYLPWRGVINDWRKHTLELNSLPILGPSPKPFGSIALNLYGFSEQILPRPKDWKSSSLITSYWLLNSSEEALPAPLMDFIRSGPPPIYFGFGSPGTYKPDRIFEVIVQACLRTETRAVISLPQGTHVTETPPHVYMLRESVPHPALFPLMQGAVHHGGAGTTGTALLAGIPSLVTPVAVDQFFWGERASALGVGPRPIPQRTLCVENLVDGLGKMKEERMRARARELGEKLRREDGTGQAVEEIVRLLA